MQRTLLFSFLMMAAAARSEELASVETVHPERRDLTHWISIPGNTEADVDVALYARVSGFLRDFKLDIGDEVKSGQLIAKIDAPELEQDVNLAKAQVVSAQADVKTAQANVKAAQASTQAAQAFVERVQSRSAEIDAKEAGLKSDVLKARAELSKAQKQYERTQKLFATNAATDLERENQELTVGVFQAGVAVAETQLTAIPSQRAILKKEVESAQAAAESTRAAIESAQAAVEAAAGKVGIAEAAVLRAKVWLDYTQVSVPPLGLSKPASAARVYKRFVSNGDLITAGTGGRSGMQPLVQLVVTDPMRVIADVPEAEVGRVGIGTPMRAVFYGANAEKPYAGKVIRVAPSLSASTRTLRVEMEIPNPDGTLRAGMMATVEIATDIHKGTLAIPESAVVSGKRGATTVFIADTGRAKKVDVVAGYTDHGWEEVTSKDLNENTVVIKDARKSGIVDGAAVQTAHN